MSMEPKPIIYDQNSRPISNADLNSLNTPVELHGLYCKKFRLIEKLENLRKGYILPKGVPVVNVHKVRMERKFTPWDYVLEEVKWTAIDMIEERKAKLTVCSFLSKKMKKDVKQRQTHQQEKTIYHRLVSSEMASMVSTVFGHFRSKRESTDVKKEDIAEIIKEEEERNGETFFGEMKDGDILDYDEMKMKIEEPSMKNGEGARDKGDLPVDALISDAFKPKKLKDSGALLRKYIDSFIAYEERSKARELVIEEDDNFPTPGAFFAKKIDKVHFYKELQRCMNKWNKNKSSMELNDVFSKLIKDASESESMMKLQKDNLSTYSAPSIKETDTKKRKKGNQHLTASNANIKDIKDPPALRKMTDSNIEQAGQPSNKELKKMKEKEKENMDEMLIMYYEQPLKDTEYELMFKNSIANNKSFPRRVDELQTVGFVKSIEKDRIYREFTFDPDYDDFVSDNCLELEAYVSQIDRKYSSDPKRMGDEATKQKVRSLPIECSVNIPDVFNFLPHIEEKPFFIYMDKVIKFIRASEDSPDFKKQLDNITWPLHADYFYERLHETHGNRYAIITDALNSNILTKGNHKYQEKISEFKWLFMHSNKNRKFFNCAKKRLPSYSTVTKETAYSDAQEEKKQSLPQGSSHQRFNLRFHVDKYQDYYKEKEDKRSKESYESSFLLFQNIKNHLRQDTSRGLYGGEGPQPTRMPEAIEHVALTRMIWPEAMNQNLISKIQSGQPLSGRPIDKEKTPHPQLDKIIDEIISATYQNPKPAPVPIPMPNPTPNPSMGMPISQPHPISAQTHSQVPPQPMHNQPQPMSHTGQPQPAGQPASQPMPLQTVNSPHLNPGPMTPGSTYPMKYPSNMPMQNPQMAYPGHMRGPMPDPMRPQPGMIPNQPTPEMYDQNNQPMPRQQGGNVPRGMQQNIPSNMQPSMAQSMPPTMQSNMQPSMQPGMAQNMPPTMQSNMQPSMGPNMHPQGYNNQMQPNNPKMMMGGPSGGPPPDGRNYPHNQQYYNNMPNNMQMQQMMQNKQPQQYQMRGINNMKNIGPNPGNPMMSGDNRNVGNMQSGPNMMNMSSMPNMPNGAPNMGHGNMPMNPAMGSSPMGNPQMGGPSMGNPHMGNPGMGNPGMGNPGMGNPGMGNPGMGNPGMGNPGMGNPGMGNPSMGNPSMGNPNMPMGGMPMGNQPSMGGAMPPMNAAPDTKKTKNTKNR